MIVETACGEAQLACQRLNALSAAASCKRDGRIRSHLVVAQLAFPMFLYPFCMDCMTDASAAPP